ncbi:MAG: hypothetical protein JWN15_377, partial [Firmicutes bacterium]|nr:hypothetical protein [Bacillota bacterium]
IDEPEAKDAEAVTVVLPVALTLSDWAERWHWNTVGLRNPSMKIDRVVYRLGAAPTLDLSGPSGQYYRVGPLTEKDHKALQELIRVMEPELFQKYRPLAAKEVTVRVLSGIQVPDVGAMPGAKVSARTPEVKWEEVRYFPDLSVVRQIDEKDARSLTDGQRLVRLTASGVLEYRAADAQGTAPELPRAEQAARDWVDARGGWPQDLVMGSYVQEPGKTTLVFEQRSQGPFPVESAGGALTIQVAADRADPAADRILSLRRLPDLVPAFDQSMQPIIKPERAIQIAAEEFPSIFFLEALREVHLAYLIVPESGTANAGWVLEPVWVLQAGEERVYVAALAQSRMKPVNAGPHTR